MKIFFCYILERHTSLVIQQHSVFYNSLTFSKQIFVLSGTITSVTVTFFQKSKLKFYWHAEKTDLEELSNKHKLEQN